MPHIVVIGGSNREASQSHRIAEVIAARLEPQGATVDLLSLRDVDIPMWDEEKWSSDKPADSAWNTVWAPVSERLKKADGLVVVTPEWHGMASPMLKNLLCCCDQRELAFKPAYLVAVSAGAGGAYPIAELRMTGGKNNYAHWLPDHLIIRQAADFRPGDPENKAPDWLVNRLDHGLKILCAYAEAAKPIRSEVVDLDILKNGM
ncbi:MAG: NAD(P)H-dependent oxidoreductase [Pseudomonadota bacterium]